MSQPGHKRVGELPFQRMNDEVLVVDPRTREVHLLNETAGRVWELLDKQISLDEIVGVLAGEYDASPHVMRAEVEALLGELGRKRLLADTKAV